MDEINTTETTETENTATPEATPEDLELAEVCRVLANPDPDGPTVRIKAAYRDLSCKGSGPECYRRLRYPLATSEVWPDSDRLPAPGITAASRRATVFCEVPVGTLVVDFERQVYKGSRGKCKVTIGVAYRSPVTGKPTIAWCEHRTLRSRPVYEVSLPNGEKIEVARKEY